MTYSRNNKIKRFTTSHIPRTVQPRQIHTSVHPSGASEARFNCIRTEHGHCTRRGRQDIGAPLFSFSDIRYLQTTVREYSLPVQIIRRCLMAVSNRFSMSSDIGSVQWYTHRSVFFYSKKRIKVIAILNPWENFRF